MGVMWRSLRDGLLQTITGESRQEYVIGASDALVEAVQVELRKVLLRFQRSCPHGQLLAIDSFDLHWGGEDRAFLPQRPEVSIRFVCRHDSTAGTFSPHRVVIVERPTPTDAELSEIARERAEAERTLAEGKRLIDEMERRRLNQQLGRNAETEK